MAISKVIYKSSPQATGVTWMDATTATAAAADILAPKTAMLADGVMTTGTGTGGGGGLTAKTGTYIFASDYTVTKANAASWAEGAVVTATGLTDLKCISFISEEVLNRSGTPARPFVGAGIWMRGSDPTNTNYLNNSKGIDGGQTVGSSNWNGTNIYGSKVISTHEMNPDNCPAGSFALFAYSRAYYFKAGQKIIWEAIGTL